MKWKEPNGKNKKQKIKTFAILFNFSFQHWAWLLFGRLLFDIWLSLRFFFFIYNVRKIRNPRQRWWKREAEAKRRSKWGNVYYCVIQNELFRHWDCELMPFQRSFDLSLSLPSCKIVVPFSERSCGLCQYAVRFN